MILVTGGTGLVGSHLLYQLVLQNKSVVAIHRKKGNLSQSFGSVKNVFSYYTDNFEALFSSIIWVEADITDITSLTVAFQNITHVYHCAAMISFGRKDYRKMRKINIEGTANIVNLCIAKQIKKLCFVSSVAAVGKPLIGNQITEDNEWNIAENNSGYAITKYGSENEVWRASQEGVDVVIVNPGVILGGGFWKSGSGKLFDKTYKGFKFYTEGVTGFVSVIDVAKVMTQLMQSSIKNERYLLVSENVSFKTVFFAIADGFKKKRPSVKVNKLMSGIAWRLGWLLSKLNGKEPLITKQSANSSHSHSHYSNTKIKEAIDFQFLSLEETILATCKDYMKDIKNY